MKRYMVVMAAAIACFQARIEAQISSPPNIRNGSTSDGQVQTKANDLLRQMTLEEKIAQLSQLPGLDLVPGFKENVPERLEQIIQRLGAGSVLWISDPKDINRLQHIAVDQSRLHIPIL